MKFQKVNSGQNSITTPLVSSDDVVKANRFEERRAREEAYRLNPPASAYARAKMDSLLKRLSGSITCNPLRPDRTRPPMAKPNDPRDIEAAKRAAGERLDALKADYAEAPALLSTALIAQNKSRLREPVPGAPEE